MEAAEDQRAVLEFEHSVRAYPPTAGRGYWRIRWLEDHRRVDTTASTRAEAIAKATEIVERVGRGTATAMARSNGADLVAHYLDPHRRPARVKEWSERMRDEQVRYCERFVLPIIATVPCRELGRPDFQRVLEQAPTASVARQLRRCLSGLMNAGLIEGHLLPRQDVMRSVRWLPPDGQPLGAEPVGRAITQAEIPTTEAVRALGRECADRSKIWWRELEILLVAYSGLRWGEHTALTAAQIDPARRRISVDRQVIETRSMLKESLPKGRRQRVTMYPATTPAGADLAAMVLRRLGEVDDDGVLFPGPRGGWARRSNYGRNLWDRPPPRSAGPDPRTARGPGRSTHCAMCSPLGRLPSRASASKTFRGSWATPRSASRKTSTSTSRATCTRGSTTPPSSELRTTPSWCAQVRALGREPSRCEIVVMPYRRRS
jgi:integrase